MADFTSFSDDLYAEDRNPLLGMSVEQIKQIEASLKAGNFLEAVSGVQKFKNLSDNEFSIAIAGESGSGKSSFINAIRGLGDEDKDAAEIGVMETTKEPAQYSHPMYPTVLFWDLPGIDTPGFRPDAYLKQVKFGHCVVFIIIASERFRANHIKLAQEIQRMGKKFYFVRSKVDLDLYNEKHRKSFNEERILEKIRNNCVSSLSEEGMSSPQVFLVSSREFQKYDCPKLQETLLKELYSSKGRAIETPSGKTKMEQLKVMFGNIFTKYRDTLPGLSEKEINEIKAALAAGDLSAAAYVVHKSDELLKKTELNIAITGESGDGKSSFLNAFRGIGDEDEGSAETGVTETTKEPMRYQHFKYPNVIFWDLPGIGQPNVQPDAYLEQVTFSRYDFFIILASTRFKDNHIKLAKEIRRMGKKFYFVRSKVDVDLHNEKDKKSFNEERILETMRNDCIRNLSREGMIPLQVFLVSSKKFQKYDSSKLQKRLLKDLESHKKHVFLLALPNLSVPILEKKKKALQRQVWKQALKSCAIAAIPLPALSVKCDIGLLVDNMRLYCESFGLDDTSLILLASQVRKSVPELKDVIKSPLAKDVSKEKAETLLTQATGEGLMVAKHFVSMIPVVGTIFAAHKSFTVIYKMLNSFLNDVAEDAQRVLIKALAQEEGKNE